MNNEMITLLAHGIAEYFDQAPERLGSLHAHLFDSNGTELGEHFNPVRLLVDLLEEQTMIDLFVEDSGSVPVDISDLVHIELRVA